MDLVQAIKKILHVDNLTKEAIDDYYIEDTGYSNILVVNFDDHSELRYEFANGDYEDAVKVIKEGV